MNKIYLKIITPERILFEESVDQVSLPSKQGEITVLPNHIPLISLLRSGEIIITAEKKKTLLVISGGFAEITGSKILILADTAERIEEIDEKRALEAKERAEKLIKDVKIDSQDYAALSAKIEKELARIHVWRKHRMRIDQLGTGEKKYNEENSK